MRIGICDDEQQTCAELRELLQTLRTGDEITVYTKAAGLLAAVREGTAFDLLFLDIYLPDMKGNNLAREIRELHPEPLPSLVFVTASKEYAVEAFAMRAIHYLVKPFTLDDIQETLRRLPQTRKRRQGIQFHIKGVSRFLTLDEIALCESNLHEVTVTLMDGESFSVYQALSKLRLQMSSQFILISRGVLVNADYIEIMKDQVLYFEEREGDSAQPVQHPGDSPGVSGLPLFQNDENLIPPAGPPGRPAPLSQTVRPETAHGVEYRQEGHPHVREHRRPHGSPAHRRQS